jgi:hypothetical protein
VAIYVGDCRRCGAKKISFKVFGFSIAKAGPEGPPGEKTYVTLIELACKCPNCQSATLFMLAAAGDKPPSTKFDENENPANSGYQEMMSFPSAAAEKAPEHTPEPAASFYHQATTALANGLHDAAGCMFRKCLESVTRSPAVLNKVPAEERDNYRGSWLKGRISKLKEMNAIPPALGDLADVIKEEGDSAVHEDVLYDPISAERLRKFTRAFLEYTFTWPEHVRQIRSSS